MLAILLLTLAASVSALFTPIARSPHHHHALAARVAAPEPVAAAVPIVAVRPLRKRQSSGRCVKPTTSSLPAVGAAGADPAAATPSSSSSPTPSPSPTPTPPPAPAVVDAAPAPPADSPAPPPPAPPASSPPPPPAAAPASPPPSGKPPLSGGPADGTFYSTGLGACGITNVDTDMIAAISKIDFDQHNTDGNPNHNELCGRVVDATYNGKTVRVTLTDRCEACGQGALDFSPSAFSVLSDQSVGRIHGMTWHSVD